MGEMADFALEQMYDCDEIYNKLITTDEREWTNEDREFMQDYDGTLHQAPISFRRPKARGPGKCPKCGAETKLKDGKYGKFYGCTQFPECKGNRDP